MHIGNFYRFKKEDWVQQTADWLLEKIDELLQSNETITLAISGGNTPLALFEYWTTTKIIDWSRVKVFWVDERCVSTTSKESNYGNAITYLKKLEGIQLFPMFIGEPKHLEKIATQYQQVIEKNTKIQHSIPTFDLVLLGMGNDGHYASLFPNSAGLEEKENFVMVNWIETLNQNRLTITNNLIQQADNVVVLINDSTKNQLLADVIFTEKELPIQKIVKREKPTTWIYSI